MITIRETDLPVIGRKYQIDVTSGDRLTIVNHTDGQWQLYHHEPHEPERVASVVTLLDSEARQIAAILGRLTRRRD